MFKRLYCMITNAGGWWGLAFLAVPINNFIKYLNSGSIMGYFLTETYFSTLFDTFWLVKGHLQLVGNEMKMKVVNTA